MYFLDPKLHNYQKVDRFNCCEHLGHFIGFSDDNPSLIANVRNLQTGHDSLQYQVVLDVIFNYVSVLVETDFFYFFLYSI